MKRAAIYARVSTVGQEENGTSLVTQEERCRQHAAQRGHIVSEEHVYTEVFTGTELWDRPRLTQLRDAIRRQQVDVVIAYAIDRLARDPVHLGVVLSEADHKGIVVEFVTETLDDSPEGQLIRFVRGYAAKVEHEKIRERSIRGKRARVESGKLLRGIPDLYGYRLNRELGTRETYEPEAAIVRRIFELYVVEGLSQAAIARIFNAEGIPAPSVGKRQRTNGHVPDWRQGTIRAILRHEAYIGESYGWKYQTSRRGTTVLERPRDEWIALPAGTTPAIIDRASWDITQQKLETNRGEHARNQARPCLLRGLIFCSVCGRRLYVDEKHGRRYYRCPSQQATKQNCGGVIVQAAPAEEWAWGEVCKRLKDPAIIEQEQRARRSPANARTKRDLQAARKRLSEIVRSQERVLARYSESDSVPWDLVEREIQRGEREKEGIRQRIAELEAQRQQEQATATRLASLNDWCVRVAANLDTLNFAEKRKVLDVLAVRVEASGFNYEPIQINPWVF